MRKVYHLSTCTTCKRMIHDLDLTDGFEIQDIKNEGISPEQLEEMKNLAGSYEALFSRRAMKFRQMGLHEQKLTETDFRDLILKEYTFLKRPVVIIDDEIFVGSSRKNINILKQIRLFE